MGKNKDKNRSGKEAPAGQKKQEPKETTMEFIASMAGLLVNGLFIITFVVQTFVIPSSSMEDTLLIGDHVFVDRVTLAPKSGSMGSVVPYRDIKRGDIVVFLSPAEAGLYVVKRIRGVPGDHLRLRDGKLYVNGRLEDEPFVQRNGGYIPYRDNFPAVAPNELSGLTAKWAKELPSHIQSDELVVPPGSYFAMGDNRDVSYDSRFWGFIPQQNIIGRPLAIYWSFEATGDEYTQTAMSDRLLSLLHTAIHFFDKTRWRRTLQMVR